MSCSSRVLLALLVLLAPSALAQERAYDPLVLSHEGYLAADGRIVDEPPAAGAVPFPPATPAAPAAPLRFVLTSPVRFAPGAAFDVAFEVRADAPVVARDADGNAFEVTVEPGGEAVRVALDPPVLAPGSVAPVAAKVVAGSALYAEGEEISLLVRPLMPLAEGALSLLVGGEPPARFAAPDMRVPTPADLRLQEVAHTEFLLDGEAFQPPASHAVNAFVVGHASIRPPAEGAWSAAGTYVVLRGEEPDAEAKQHAHAQRDARVEAAHELRVNGVPVRVHPGLGVVVRAQALPLRVDCERHCPPGGFAWSYAPPPAVATEPPSTLVAPPRDTRGIPVSADEPASRETPSLPVAGLLVAAALALAVSKR